MASALIGHSGFVGSTLAAQTQFTDRYRSTDIAGICGRSFAQVVCAGAPAQKWKANKEPAQDLQAIDSLIGHLATVTADHFVLVSTVDVFPDPVGVDEGSPIAEGALQPYGLHRLKLERFVAQRFPRHTIVRLPGLVGPGLRKNIIFDLRHGNNVHLIETRNAFQFYPMVNLWPDIQASITAGVDLIHLTAAPVTVGEVAAHGFGRELRQEFTPPPVRYDFRTRLAAVLGQEGHYHYSRRESLLAIRHYAQGEPATPRATT